VPVVPLVEEPLEPVLVPDPVASGDVPDDPVPVLPDEEPPVEPPIEPLEPVLDPLDPVLDPLEPVSVEEPEEPPIEPDEPELPEEEPFGITSIWVTSAVEPEPEKLARTWSPSLMSESDAVRPFFVTCVLSLTLSDSDSSFFFLSNFWTLPVTSCVPDADADEPIDEPAVPP
jgi:hypothetical protein